MNKDRIKQEEFNKAMKFYKEKDIYEKFSKLISIINVGGQILLIFLLLSKSMSLTKHLASIIIAFLLADFWNGLVHLYMDNNDNYNGFFGPLVASFHLHHRTPLYKKKPVLRVYFDESGAKIWMAAVEILVISFVAYLPNFIAFTFIYFFIWSSFAEVSHYFCHTVDNSLISFLQKIKLILNKKHHAKHHMTDNINYAFLNGVSDPLINVIAKKLYNGYKEGTDKHYESYKGEDSSNR